MSCRNWATLYLIDGWVLEEISLRKRSVWSRAMVRGQDWLRYLAAIQSRSVTVWMSVAAIR
jgi:3-methyladenine DNA glycosylase AlkD